MDKNKYILDEAPRPKTWADGGRQCPYCHEIIDPGEHHVCKPKTEEKPVNKQVQKPAPKVEPEVKEKPEDKPVKNARPGDPDDKGYTIDEPDDDRTHGNYESHNEQVIANLKSLEIGDCLREMENLLSMDADFLNESVLNEKAKTVLRGEGDNTTDESKRLTKNFVYKMSSDKVKAKELEIERLKEIYKKTKNPKIKSNIERKKVELKKLKFENSANFHAKVVANNSETNDQNMYEDYSLDIKNDYTLDEAKNLAQPGHATSVTSNNNRLDYAKQAMENRKDQLSRQQEVLNAQKEKLMQEKEKNAEKIKNIENNVTDAETKKNMISAVNNNTEIKNNQIKSKEERVRELSGDKKEAQETFEVVKNRAEKSLRESFEFTYDELLQEDEAPTVPPVKEPEKVKEPKQPKVKPASVKEIVVSISLGRYGQLDDIDIHSTEDKVNFTPLISKIRGSQKLRKICFDRKRIIDSNEDNAAYRTSALLKKALRSEIRSFMADENVKLHKVSIVVESVETNGDEEILTEAKYPTARDLAFGGETGKIIDVVINNTDYPANPEYKQIASKLKRSTVFKNLLFKYKRELDRVNPSRETLTGLKFKIKSEITKCKKNK